MISNPVPTSPRFSPRSARSLAQTLKRYEALLIPLSIALGSRAILLVAADLFMRFILKYRHLALPFTGVFSVWQRKDALWYAAIAQFGYNYSPVAQSRANFFPLFPLLIHLFEPIVGIFPVSEPYELTGMAISWALFAGACVGLYRLTLDHFGRQVAIIAVTLLAVFPFSFYYGAAYTESIYLVLAVWAFVAIERDQWWIAAALAGIASASRPPGLLIGVCVIFAYLLDWYRTRHPLRINILALALTPLGTLAYMLYCWARWGDPLAYVKTSRAGWGGGQLQLNGVRFIAHVLRHAVSWIGTRDPNHIIVFFAILVMLGCLAVAPFTLRLLGPTYALFTFASIIAPIIDFPNANSLGRYMSVIFPLFMVLAYALRGRPILRWTLYIASSACLLLLAAFFIGYGLS